MKIRAGSTFYDRGGQLRKVKKYFIHPKYNSKEFTNDFALLLLEQPLKLNNKTIKTIELNRKSYKIPKNITCYIAGWGKFSNRKRKQQRLNKTQTQLRWGELFIVNSNYCEEILDITLSRDQFCASNPYTSTDSCQGDSGGPIIENDKVIGVVSFGFGKCGTHKKPGVYGSTVAAIKWIDKILKDL